MKDMPKKLRAKQITQYFPIGLSTVWLYVRQGKLTVHKVSSRISVFDTKEVIKLFGVER